ncbi:hypothetical protein TNCV_2348051 [Trichonephila clavipes]|uniref:Uncharacterized protein n=1 Tax=Trichonephila clavipes TaxID=2585209 RepID=A0A8X6VQG5_TRICX|nr:hypothetical protein TNCV_2348051 [Trichonephila clavipes]
MPQRSMFLSSIEKTTLRFGVPMRYRYSKHQSDECYICPCHILRYNHNNQKLIYHVDNIPSGLHPIPYGPNMPVPLPPFELLGISSKSDYSQVQDSGAE